jgi:hypothetical protein
MVRCFGMDSLWFMMRMVLVEGEVGLGEGG